MIYFHNLHRPDKPAVTILRMHIMMKRLGNIFCIWPSDRNHSAIYQIHYTGVTWALWRLKSLATLLIVQQLLQANKYENKMSILTTFCEGNPPVTSGPPNQGTVLWKVSCYFNGNHTEIHSWGTNYFSDGLFH